MTEQATKQVDIRSYLKAVWRRKWLLLIPVVVAGVAGGITAQMLPPIYEAKSTVVVRMSDRLSEPLARLVGRSPMEEQLSRLQQKAKSTSFLVELVRTLGMANDEDIQQWARSQNRKDPSVPVAELAESRAVSYLQPRIAVVRTSSTGFQVVARDFEPERATLLAQHITNAFVSASNREQLEEIRSIHDFSVEQLVIYKQKLDDAERQLREFQEGRITSGPIANPVTAQNVNRADVLMSQAQVEGSDAAAALANRRGTLRSLASAEYDALAGLTSAALDYDSDQLVSLEREVASVLVRSSADGPEISSLYVSIAEKKTQLRDDARRLARDSFGGLSIGVVNAYAELKIAQVEDAMISERLRILRRFMWDYTQGRVSVPEEEMELTRLRQEVENNRALYEAFLEQSAAGQITEALEAARAGGRFEIIEPPVRPTGPVAPDKPMIILLSLFGGLVIGLGIVLATEQGDTSFKDIADIEATLGVPVLATVPEADVFHSIGSREKQLRRGGRKATGGDSMLLRYMVRETPISFEFRRLTRKLSKMNGGDIPKSILVTSSNRGEGKTTVAACLAITLAKHYGRRVALVDCDLRKPRAHMLMEVAQRPGLADALQRGNLLGSDIRATSLDTLFVVPSGTRRDEPTWVLESLPNSRVMAELMGSFDHVIFDTAPNVAVPDALLLSSEVDGVIMVLRAGATPREVILRGVQLQLDEKDNMLGLVVNNLQRVLPYYYDYRYYGYGASESEHESKDESEE
ncbi:MAG: polysaccharide biosynthesis tyrosine autokinase [Candidatus Eisenbacteria bacterium]